MIFIASRLYALDEAPERILDAYSMFPKAQADLIRKDMQDPEKVLSIFKVSDKFKAELAPLIIKSPSR